MIGRTVSHYEIVERLGGGGMGLVYRARDTRLDRDVALKFLPREWSNEPLLRERFSREARAASALDHAHICPVFDIGETEDGQLFIAMAFTPGHTLKHRILEGALPAETAVDLAIQIASALESAHAAGIVHRDIKPANILITEDDQSRLVDFGLAKLAGEAAVTREGSVIGTPAYMSPEQASGDEVDGRSDLWSLGVVLYEMLAGRRAFAADNERAVLLAIMSSDPTPIETFRPHISAELARIIRRLLERNPDRRYQTATEVLADLRRFRGDPTPAEIVTQTLPSAPRMRRRQWVKHRLLPGAAAAAALIIVASFYPAISQRTTRHVLVLPFTCHATTDEERLLCEGLLETVTAQLAGVRRFGSALSVVPVSEVREKVIRSAGEARRVFGVDLVIVGGIQRDAGVFRIPLELVDAERLRQVHSRLLTVEESSTFVLQDRVLEAILEMLEFEIDDEAERFLSAAGTANAEAAHLFLEARGTAGEGLSEDRLSRAMDLYRRALDLDPSFAEALVELAATCLDQYGNTADHIWLEHGTAYVDRALQVAPDLPQAHLVAGRFDLARQAYAGAVDRFERAIEIDPLNLRAYSELAVAYQGLDEPELALATIDRAIRTGPEDWLTHYDIGRYFFYRRFDPGAAEPYFRRVTELIPDSSIGHNALGACLLQLGRLEEARQHLERALEIGATYDAHSNLATLDFYEGRYGAAAAGYRRALEIDDADYTVWNNLGEACRFQDPPDLDGARTAFSTAADKLRPHLEADPENRSLQVDMASYSVQLGDDAAARTILGEIASSEVDDPNLMFSLAAVFEELGERGQALEWIDRCLRAGFTPAMITAYPGFADLISDPRFHPEPPAHDAR